MRISDWVGRVMLACLSLGAFSPLVEGADLQNPPQPPFEKGGSRVGNLFRLVEAAPELERLRQRITEVHALLARMAELETALQAAAGRAGAQADSAREPAEMDRYETLYRETRLRILELQDQQTELRALLERLEATLARLGDDAL